MDAATIDDLLQRLRSGDEAAAAQVYRAYEPFLRRVVRRRLPTQAQARFDSGDVLQSVWADLLPGLREARWRFADAGQLRAFLIRVVQNRLYDRSRRALRQTTQEEPLAALPEEPPAAQPRPSEHAQAIATWERLLAYCPPEHHDVLRLRRAGLTFQEIADAVGMHEGSVRRVVRELARRVAFAPGGEGGGEG
jgi:RNA polymerase sigma factor (sigma-70 family)